MDKVLRIVKVQVKLSIQVKKDKPNIQLQDLLLLSSIKVELSISLLNFKVEDLDKEHQWHILD